MSKYVTLLTLTLLVASTFLQLTVSQTNAQAQTCSPDSIMHITLGYGGPPHSLNPFAAGFIGAGGFILLNFEYLHLGDNVQQNGTADWSLSAVDWYSHNNDYTQWTFNVRPGLKWSDGTDVTANDILATFSTSYALSPDYDEFGIGPEIAKQYALNSSAAVFDLKVHDAHFPELIKEGFTVPVFPASVVAQGPTNNFFSTEPVDGPFQIQNYQAGSTEMIMYRNPYFTPLPAVCELDINFVETEALTPSYVTSGSTDFADISNSQASLVYASPNVGGAINNGSAITAIELNNTVYPYNMTAFRQALVFGMDSATIVSQAFNGFALPGAQGIVSPSSSLYNPNQKLYKYDPTQALALLQSIGIKKGSKGHLQYPDGTDVSLKLWSDSGRTSDVVAASIIQRNLQSLGMTVLVEVAQQGNIVAFDATNAYDIQHDMLLYTNTGTHFGDAWLDAQNGFGVYLDGKPGPYWEYPPSVDAQFQSNVTAVDATADPTLLRTYVDNIQMLNSESIPAIVVAFPDNLFAYNTLHFTNWNPGTGGLLDYDGLSFNIAAWAAIAPISATTSTTSSVTPSPTSAPISATLAASIVGIVVVIAIAGALIYRRRSMRTSKKAGAS